MPSHDSISVTLFDKSKVTLGKKIGSGSFGRVYKASILDSNLSEVAVKVFKYELKKREVSQTEKDTAYEELLKVAVLDHENIVKLHGVVKDESNELPWLVFEFMKDGNLLEYVLRNENVKEKTLLRFCKDICCGMAFLHNNKVLHKDLAARNILLNGKTAKISDLGLSSFLRNDEGEFYALNGKLFPYRHAAVECIVEQVYTYESDVWSFGILMYEMFSKGQMPYGKEHKQPEVRRLIVEGITPLHLLEPHCSTKILVVMKSILNPHMKERPNFPLLYKRFNKMLNGMIMGMDIMSNENLTQTKDSSVGVSAFHKIKANGLSNSFNNLQINSQTNGSSNLILTSVSNKDYAYPSDKNLLAVNDGFSSMRSSSTSDLVNALGHSATMVQQFTNNFLSVRSPQSPVRRHSLAKLDSNVPLHQKHLPDVDPKPLAESPKQNDGLLLDEPRKRASSSSRVLNNHLLDGFVQNRFTRKT